MVHVGGGDCPASVGNGGRGGGGGAAAPAGGAAGGGRQIRGVVSNAARGLKYGSLRYSSAAEADAARREVERGLRLKRLEQVRQQSRQHAAAMRAEYRARREENKRAAVLEYAREFKAARDAEVLALNQQLQNKLLAVGTAHRMAAYSNIARGHEENRLRAKRSASAERRRSRNLAASEKNAAELREARRGMDIAEHRQEVWRGVGEEEKVRAREEAAKKAAAADARRERAEIDARRRQQRAENGGVVNFGGGRVTQVGPRLEDFKTSRVHASLVLRHGSQPGTRLLGVATATGNPAVELQRKDALAKERREAAEEATYRAEERGQDALLMERDRRVASGLEEELKRLHELDRWRRQGNGATETNLASLREREIRRSSFGEARAGVYLPEQLRSRRTEERRSPQAGANVGMRVSSTVPVTRKVDDSEWREWPSWWPTPPPRSARTTTAAAAALGGATDSASPNPSAATMSTGRERLRLIEETRRGLFDSALKAENPGQGRAPSAVVSAAAAAPSAAASAVTGATASGGVSVATGTGGVDAGVDLGADGKEGEEHRDCADSGVPSPAGEAPALGVESAARPIGSDGHVISASSSIPKPPSGADLPTVATASKRGAQGPNTTVAGSANAVPNHGQGPAVLLRKPERYSLAEFNAVDTAEDAAPGWVGTVDNATTYAIPGAPIHSPSGRAHAKDPPLVSDISRTGAAFWQVQRSSTPTADPSAATSSGNDDRRTTGMALSDRSPESKRGGNGGLPPGHGVGALGVIDEGVRAWSTGSGAGLRIPRVMMETDPGWDADSEASPPLEATVGRSEGQNEVVDVDGGSGTADDATGESGNAVLMTHQTVDIPADSVPERQPTAQVSVTSIAGREESEERLAEPNAKSDPKSDIQMPSVADVARPGASVGEKNGGEGAMVSVVEPAVATAAGAEPKAAEDAFGGSTPPLPSPPPATTSVFADMPVARSNLRRQVGDTDVALSKSKTHEVVWNQEETNNVKDDNGAYEAELTSDLRNGDGIPKSPSSPTDPLPRTGNTPVPQQAIMGANREEQGRERDAYSAALPMNGGLGSRSATGAEVSGSGQGRAATRSTAVGIGETAKESSLLTDAGSSRVEGDALSCSPRSEIHRQSAERPNLAEELSGGGGWSRWRRAGENIEEGRVSVATSSSSTLPPLDEELAELLERHRRLDAEAAELTRRAEADAIQWGPRGSDNGSSSAEVVGDRARSFASRSACRDHVDARPPAEKVAALAGDVRGGSKRNYSVGVNSMNLLPEALGLGQWAADHGGGAAGGGRGGSVSSTPTSVSSPANAGDHASRRAARGHGDGTGGGGAISWDYEIATAFSQQGPAASGWTQRWRPGGMPGSRAALGLWDDGAGLLDEEANKARGVGHLSSQGNVDTAQEVTEWARRIQASIESMNRLVDGFQIAGGLGVGSHSNGGSSRSDPVPAGSTASSSRGSDTPAGAVATAPTTTGVRSGGRRGSDLSRHVKEDVSSFVPGVQSFANAQLGFRRGLEGLLVGRSRGGNAGGGGDASRKDAASGVGETRGAALLFDSPENLSSDTRGTGKIDEAPRSGCGDSNSSGNGDDGFGRPDECASYRARDDMGPSIRGVDASAYSLEARGERLLGPRRGDGKAEPPRSELLSVRDDRWGSSLVSSTRISRDAASAISSSESNTFVTSEGHESGGWEETKGDSRWRGTAAARRRRTVWEDGSESGGGGGGGARERTTGDEGVDGVEGGAGWREGSVTSWSNNSFGPDLEAEIASLEALAASLQQRKMCFDPKPALLVQQQQELEEHRRALRAGSILGSSSAASADGSDERGGPHSPSGGDSATALGGLHSSGSADASSIVGRRFVDSSRTPGPGRESFTSGSQEVQNQTPPRSAASSMQSYENILQELRLLKATVTDLAPAPAPPAAATPLGAVGMAHRFSAEVDHAGDPRGSPSEAAAMCDATQADGDGHGESVSEDERSCSGVTGSFQPQIRQQALEVVQRLPATVGYTGHTPVAEISPLAATPREDGTFRGWGSCGPGLAYCAAGSGKFIAAYGSATTLRGSPAAEGGREQGNEEDDAASHEAVVASPSFVPAIRPCDGAGTADADDGGAASGDRSGGQLVGVGLSGGRRNAVEHEEETRDRGARGVRVWGAIPRRLHRSGAADTSAATELEHTSSEAFHDNRSNDHRRRHGSTSDGSGEEGPPGSSRGRGGTDAAAEIQPSSAISSDEGSAKRDRDGSGVSVESDDRYDPGNQSVREDEESKGNSGIALATLEPVSEPALAQPFPAPELSANNLSIDADLAHAESSFASSRRQIPLGELSPLEAPGWGSLADYIEGRFSNSEGSGDDWRDRDPPAGHEQQQHGSDRSDDGHVSAEIAEEVSCNEGMGRAAHGPGEFGFMPTAVAPGEDDGMERLKSSLEKRRQRRVEAVSADMRGRIGGGGDRRGDSAATDQNDMTPEGSLSRELGNGDAEEKGSHRQAREESRSGRDETPVSGYAHAMVGASREDDEFAGVVDYDVWTDENDSSTSALADKSARVDGYDTSGRALSASADDAAERLSEIVQDFDTTFSDHHSAGTNHAARSDHSAHSAPVSDTSSDVPLGDMSGGGGAALGLSADGGEGTDGSSWADAEDNGDDADNNRVISLGTHRRAIDSRDVSYHSEDFVDDMGVSGFMSGLRGQLDETVRSDNNNAPVETLRRDEEQPGDGLRLAMHDGLGSSLDVRTGGIDDRNDVAGIPTDNLRSDSQPTAAAVASVTAAAPGNSNTSQPSIIAIDADHHHGHHHQEEEEEVAARDTTSYVLRSSNDIAPTNEADGIIEPLAAARVTAASAGRTVGASAFALPGPAMSNCYDLDIVADTDSRDESVVSASSRGTSENKADSSANEIDASESVGGNTGGSGGGNGSATALTEDSLKASERSEDSLSAVWKGGASTAADQEPSPRAGVAVAWNVTNTGVGDSPAVEGSRERFTAEMPPDGDGSQRREQGHEGGATELAAFFSSRASSFISRSRAREVALRERREARQRARDDTTAAATAAAAMSNPTPTPNMDDGGVRRPRGSGSRERRSASASEVAGPPPGFVGDDGQARRKVSTQEARARTARLYNNLPEVRMAREKKEQSEERVRRLLTARALEKERSRYGRSGGGGREGAGGAARK